MAADTRKLKMSLFDHGKNRRKSSTIKYFDLLKTVFTCFLLSNFAMLALAGERSNQMVHALSDDPSAVAIQWRTLGGLAGRDDNPPDITIFADGSITVGPRLGRGETVKGQITAERLQQLMSFAIDDNHFFSFDSAAVEKAVNAEVKNRRSLARSKNAIMARVGPPYIDAGTTVILIAADDKRHEVSYHGLFAAAQDFPEIEELRQLRMIELKLLDLAEEIVDAAGH